MSNVSPVTVAAGSSVSDVVLRIQSIPSSSAYDEMNLYGTANRTIISSGGTQNIFGSASVDSAMNEVLLHGVANDTVIYNGGEQVVSGIVYVLTQGVDAGSSVKIAGSANKTTVNASGRQTIKELGVASDTTVNSQGVQVISANGYAENTKLNRGDYNGGQGGAQVVFGSANSTTVEANARQTVSSGGIAENTVLSGLGQDDALHAFQNVELGGLAIDAKINEYGRQLVKSGASAFKTVINNNGVQFLTGNAVSTTVNSGGIQFVSAGGMAEVTRINSSGYQKVLNGGSANNVIVSSSGDLEIFSGGQATQVSQYIGGNVNGYVLKNDTVTKISGTNAAGAQFSLENGVASNFIIYYGGFQTVESGGKAFNTIQHSGGNVNATVTGGADTVITGVNALGEALTLSNGVASNFIVYSNGFLNVASGGRAENVIQYFMGNINVDVIAGDGTFVSGLNASGAVLSLSNGVASNFIIYAGGTQAFSKNAPFDGEGNRLAGNGGSQLVGAGGVAWNTLVSSGGTQFVSSGGSTNSTTVYASGKQIISNGGVAYDTVINAGGSQLLSGGRASRVIINQGDQTIYNGGIVDSAMLNLGVQTVSSGGLAQSTTVNSGAMLSLKGGSATNVIQNAFGNVNTWVFSQGTLNGQIGVIKIAGSNMSGAFGQSNGVASNFIIYNGGEQRVMVGGSSINTRVSAGGVQLIGDALTVTSPISMTFSGHGTTRDTTVYESGLQLVGGVASDTVLNKGLQVVFNNTMISAGNSRLDFAGIASGTIINSGGLQRVGLDSSISFGNVFFDKEMRYYWADGYNVTSHINHIGGSAVGTIINSAGIQRVDWDGVADRTLINSGGVQNIRFGAKATNTVIHSGGLQNNSGKMVYLYTSRYADGALAGQVYSAYEITYEQYMALTPEQQSASVTSSRYDGLTVGNTIFSGGVQQLLQYGVASDTVISGGTQYVSAAGSALKTTISSGGSQVLSSGGSADNTGIFNRGTQRIQSGGFANSTTVNSGGNQIISSGGEAINTSQMVGGNVDVFIYGNDDKTKVTGTNEIGSFCLESGVASNFAIYNTGSQVISNGGVANSTTIFGGIQTVSQGGLTGDTNINSGGTQSVLAGGVAVNTVVNESGIQNVRGNVTSTRINSGGHQIILGGNASSTLINHGSQTIQSSGAANYTTVNSAGEQYVFSGARATDTVLEHSGTLQVVEGVARITTVNSGAVQIVGNGGLAENTIVNSYGVQRVESGGSGNGVQVNSTGAVNVENGGRATNIIQSAGGNVNVDVLGSSTTLVTGTFGSTMFGLYNGVASNFVIFDNGLQTVSSGGRTVNTVISGGVLQLGTDGRADLTQIAGGNQQILGGVASNTTIFNGVQTVVSGSAVKTVISGGTQLIEGAGLGDGSVIVGGSQVVLGCARSTVVSNGSQAIKASGYAEATRLVSGVITVSRGGRTSGTMIEGGVMNVSGNDSDAMLTGGTQIVFFGASAVGTVIGTGGIQHITSGGLGDTVTINAGGVQHIALGGLGDTVTINAGGRLDLSAGALLNGVIRNAGTISGFGIVDGTGATITVIGNAGNTLAAIHDINLVENAAFAFEFNTGDTTAVGTYSYKLSNNVTAFAKSISVTEYNIAGTAVSTISVGTGAVYDGFYNVRYQLEVRNGSLMLDVERLERFVDAPVITVSETRPTNQNVTVTAVFDDDTYPDAFGRVYSLDGGATWNTYSGGVVFSENGRVIFGSHTYDGAMKTSEYDVTNIDKHVDMPVVTITPPTLTNGDVTVSIGYDAKAVSRKYSLDGIHFADYQGSFTVQQNTKIFYNVTDEAGNYAEGSYFVSNIDKDAPGIAANFRVVNDRSKQAVTLSWDAASDNSGVAYYNVCYNNTQNVTTTVNSITLSQLPVDSYTYRVQAVDLAGNIGAWSAEQKFSIHGMYEPGKINGYVKVNKYDVTLSWDKAPAAFPGSYIAYYELKFNNEIIRVKGTSYQLKNYMVSSGNTFSVRAVDVVNYIGQWSDLRRFDVLDVTAPILGKIFAVQDGYTAKLSWTASDNVGVSYYKVSCGNVEKTVYEPSAGFSDLNVGKQTIKVQVFDAAGNGSKIVKLTVNVKDVTPPEIITGLGVELNNSKYKATLSWIAALDNSGKIARYEVMLDNGKILKSGKPYVAVSKLSVGEHSFVVRAVDSSKNVSAWSDAVKFIVNDVSAPDKVSVTVKVQQNAVDFTWKTPKDNVGVTGYQLRFGDETLSFDANTHSYRFNGLPKGNYGYELYAFDAAGNFSAVNSGKIQIKAELAVPVSTGTELSLWGGSDSNHLLQLA